MGTDGLSTSARARFELSRPIPIAPGHDSREMNERASAGPPGHPQIQLLPWYLSGTLHNIERRQVTAHLAHCQACRAELEALTLVRRIVRESFAQAPPGLLSRLLRRIRGAARRFARSRGKARRGPGTSAA
jgi:anti-sigma factor RsiW